MLCICKAVKALANEGLSWGNRNINIVFLSLLQPVFLSFLYLYFSLFFIICIHYELYLQGPESLGPIKGSPGTIVFSICICICILSFFIICIQYELYLQGRESVGPIKGSPGASVISTPPSGKYQLSFPQIWRKISQNIDLQISTKLKQQITTLPAANMDENLKKY